MKDFICMMKLQCR